MVSDRYQLLWQLVVVHKLFKFITGQVMVVEDKGLAVSHLRWFILLRVVYIVVPRVRSEAAQE